MLLDGNSLAFRAFYALPAENFKTRGGLNTNAVYGFTAMLINLLRDEAPTHIAAAFDVSRQTFRLERYPEYKAGRSETPDEFRVEKYGLTPTQYPDFAALRGDPSDNLPGIPGVGEKTASKWIVEYGSLQGLVDNVDSVRGKGGDALRAHLANVIRNRELTDLVKDVPLAQTPDTLRLLPWDRDQSDRLFEDVEV